LNIWFKKSYAPIESADKKFIMVDHAVCFSMCACYLFFSMELKKF